MERVRELYNTRQAHFDLVFALVFVTDCRFLGSHQDHTVCAALPLVLQCLAVVAFAVSARGSRHPLLRALACAVFAGSVACLVLSIVHIKHVFAATVAIFNAYCRGVIGADLWSHQEEIVTELST